MTSYTSDTFAANGVERPLTVDERRAFIQSATLVRFGSKPQDAASVVDASAFYYEKLSGTVQKSDVEESVLFATQAADVIRRTDENKSIAWYKEFFKNLKAIGWKVPSDFGWDKIPGAGSHDTVIDGVNATFAKVYDTQEVGQLKAVTDQFKSTTDPYPLTYQLFNKSTWRSTAANFRFGVASLTGSTNVNLTITIFFYKVDDVPDTPDILFDKVPDTAVFKYVDYDLFLDESVYNDVRDNVHAKVAPSLITDVVEVPL